MTKDGCIRALAKQLGREYRVTTIDFEPVVYRDFGNGFNVEISGVYTTGKKKRATLYLWHGDRQPECIIVKTIRDVRREDIGSEVEELFRYSQSLIKKGLDNSKAIWDWKYKITNCAKGGNAMMHKIYYGSNPKLTDSDRRCFDRGKYECKALMQTAKGKPVIISQSKDKDFPVWKVEHDFSCMVFASYDEAIAYCKGRFLGLDGKAV